MYLRLLGGINIAVVKDYLQPTGLPKANVLHYTLEDGSWFCIRPSGTEPKLKIYFSVVGDSDRDAEARLVRLREGGIKIINGD